MGEKLKKDGESESVNSPVSGWDSLKNVPFAGNEQYKVEHPNAVEDINKARVMADKENYYRNQANDFKDSSRSLRKAADEASYLDEDKFIKQSVKDWERAEYLEKQAVKAGEEAGVEYDEKHTVMDFGAEHPDAVEDIDKARAMAEAEDEYRTTAARFQKMQDRRERDYEKKDSHTRQEWEQYNYDQNSSQKIIDQNNAAADAAGEEAAAAYDQQNQ